MTTTLVGVAKTLPSTFIHPAIYVAESWDAEWKYDPELTLVSCGAYASSSAISTCELSRRYGNVKFPHETEFSQKSPRDMKGWWVRVDFFTDDGTTPTFLGQIENKSSMLTGGSEACGEQSWVASGGLRILQKITMSEAVCVNPDGTKARIGWVPPMNSRDKRSVVTGNRTSDADDSGGYFYGGKLIWTHLQYLRYLIKNFVQQEDGPAWTIGGQIDILDDLMTIIDFSESGSIADAIRQLVPVRYGLDYWIRPVISNDGNSDGFEIVIFALAADDASAGGVTIPKNPNAINIPRFDDPNLMTVHIVESDERRVDVIQVQGRRIIICGTLSAAKGSLVKKWKQTIENEYKISSGTFPDEYDTARKLDRYREVYQHYGAPLNWDMENGKWSLRMDDTGELFQGPFQTTNRETLSWIPLKEGFEYFANDITDNTTGDNEPDIKPPLAWIVDTEPDDGGSPKYVQCDLAGIGVGRPHNDWGIFLNASPNHLLAYGRWDDADKATTNSYPRYDPETLLATVAIESDHRIRLAYALPDTLGAGDGSIMTIHDDGAELWVLLPGTVTDLNDDGTPRIFGDADGVAPVDGSPQLLRDDTDRLRLLLAGAVSRYINERIRAEIIIAGFVPWGFMLGQILSVVQQGDDANRVGAPITSIEWTLLPTPRTTVKTGYA